MCLNKIVAPLRVVLVVNSVICLPGHKVQLTICANVLKWEEWWLLESLSQDILSVLF